MSPSSNRRAFEGEDEHLNGTVAADGEDGPREHDYDDDCDEHSVDVEESHSLPILQFAVVLLLKLAEPITASVILPFINQVSERLPLSPLLPRDNAISDALPHTQLVRDLDITGGDDKAVGYYVGLIVRTLSFIPGLV